MNSKVYGKRGKYPLTLSLMISYKVENMVKNGGCIMRKELSRKDIA